MEQLRNLDWTLIGILTFAGVFFVVGVYRLVEFSGLGMGEKQRRLLTVLHIAGCAIFASSLVLGGLDIDHQKHKPLTLTLFICGLVVLVPGQFAVGMRRRRMLEQEGIQVRRAGR